MRRQRIGTSILHTMWASGLSQMWAFDIAVGRDYLAGTIAQRGAYWNSSLFTCPGMIIVSTVLSRNNEEHDKIDSSSITMKCRVFPSACEVTVRSSISVRRWTTLFPIIARRPVLLYLVICWFMSGLEPCFYPARPGVGDSWTPVRSICVYWCDWSNRWIALDKTPSTEVGLRLLSQKGFDKSNLTFNPSHQKILAQERY